jgi:hypothetical protein
MTKLAKEVKTRFFKINHLALSNQVISIEMYHLVLLIEFLQLLFFIFYKVQVRNEFQTFLGI